MSVFTAHEAIEMAKGIEENGEIFYNEVAAKSTDPSAKELFEHLAGQERAHYRLFEKMLENVRPGPELPAAEYDEYQAYVQAALDNALFSGQDKALALARQAQDKAALRAALGFEKDTLLFFYDLREMVSKRDREAISSVIREEKKHVRRLAGML